MKTLEAFLSEQGEITIHALGAYIGQCIDAQWQPVWQQSQQEMQRFFDRAGEPAYGVYGRTLFRPIQEQLTHAGFLTEPSFPGTLTTSREWGPIEERERWMWCVVRPTHGAPIGTLVVRLAHDHTRFRLPHPPGILALEETGADAIIQAVSHAAGHLKSREEDDGI